MFWTKEKVQNRNAELSQYRYVKSEVVSDFGILEDLDGAIGSYPVGLDFKETIALGSDWRGRDRYVWLRASVVLPEKREGCRILGFFDFGKTGDGNNAGFESLLFVDGEPYQGVDQNHKEVFFDDALAGTRVELTFRLWSGLEGGGQVRTQEHRLNAAFIGYLDVAVDDLYYTALAALQTLDYLAENSTERYGLMQALDHSFRVIDWANPGGAEHLASLYEAGRVLNAKIDAMPKNFDVTVTCVGHTHIDVAWLWRLKHTREKSARSFSTVMRLMEQYPNYEFLQSQPQLYAYIKEDYPDIYAKIKARVADGRWEADGGMWLEADCNIPSGESLVRQILQGTRFFKEEFGKESKFLWLPDVFGYSWALPQILKKSGIETFMTTKISWNQFNKMPHDTFWWRGIDGSEILTHFITTPDNAHDIYYTYNGNITARAVKGVWDSYNDKNLNQELLVSYGYGDGGGGPTREMLEMIERFDRMPGMPKVETGLAGPYFERLHERVENSEEYVHTWNGELYFEYHRGTYTSQAHNKKMNRKLELLLRDAEWFQVLQAVRTGDFAAYPSDLLQESWRIVLRNQFHDIIPGSSIHEVYEDCVVEYDEAENLALMAYDEMSAMDEDAPNKMTLLNSSIWERPRLAEIAIATDEPVIWKDADGKRLDAQRNLAGSWLVAVAGLPSMGTATLTYEVDTKPSDGKPLAQVHDRGLETNRYRVTWNEAGQFTAIFDKANERDVLAKGERGNVLQVFEDKPLNFDAWDIDIYYQEKMREVTQLESVTVTQNGELQTTLRMEWLYGRSRLAQNIHFYRDSARIDFETELDWHEKQQLLKVAFPVDVMATEATYDIQYGNVKRPTHWNTSWDYARFETVGHQWADLSETGYGVSILNNCKYGHDIKDHVMRLTLLKSATYPDVTQDQGEHVFTYSLLPHAGDFVEGDVVQEAWALNNPLRAALGSHDNRSLLQSNNEQIQIDALKKAEDDDAIIVRLHEYTGGRGKVIMTSDFQIKSWQECDLMERPIGEEETGEWTFSVTPYEVKTFKIKLK